MVEVPLSAKRILLVISLGVFLMPMPCLTAIGEAEEPREQTGELTVPWDEFKQLLNLDDDQIIISLSTFQKLLAQTTDTAVPQHAIQDGNVVLTRATFQQLIEQMRPTAGAGGLPPYVYLMTKATYSATMKRETTEVTGTFHVHVLSDDLYLRVPFLPQSIALEDVTVDGQPGLVVSENGHHQVVLSSPGEHVIQALFSLKSSLTQGPHKIDLMIQQTPITLLRLEIPLSGIEVEIPQAQQLITTPGPDKTIVSAAITPGRAISVRWRDAPDVLDTTPPKLYCEVFHLVSIEDDVLVINSDINCNILHSEIDRVRFSIPDGINVLAVAGEGLGEWQEIMEDDERIILVPFTYARKGPVTIRVTAEQPLSEGTVPSTFSGFRVLECVRETGFLGIEVRTSAEVTVTDEAGLELVAVPGLPQALQGRAVKPLMHGFKYLKHPFHLALSIRKHQKLAVPVAAINSANAVTLLTEDGKVVHRLVYQVINSAKQFLELQLPPNADVWTVFVDDQPVESAVNGQGGLLVPLIRSRTEGDRLEAFPVEIVYCLVGDRYSGLGSRMAMLPSVDLLVSQLMWSVYLPNDYTYIHFSSTLEKEKLIRTLNVFAGAQRQYDENMMAEIYRRRQDAGELGVEVKGGTLAYKGKKAESEFRNLPMNEEQMSKQLAAELEFGRRMEGLDQLAPPVSTSGSLGGTGVLPIEISVPTGGQVYRFARTIIRPEEPLTMRVTYGANWVMSSIKWLLLILFVAGLYLTRSKLASGLRWAKGKSDGLVDFYKRHEATTKGIAQSIMTPVILVGLLLPAWLLFPPLAVLIGCLLWISVVYQIILRRQRKVDRKSADPVTLAE